MALPPRDILNIIELVFYVPAFGLSLCVLRKHGFSKQLGWFYLAILALVRVIGASTGLATIGHPSASLMQASVLCYGIGLSPLLLAMLGIVKRVYDGMCATRIASKCIDFLAAPLVAGLVLGIVGSTKVFDSGTAAQASASSYTKAAVILYALVLAALTVVTISNLAQWSRVAEGEKRLNLSALASIPFLTIRILYAVLSTFDKSNKLFNPTFHSDDFVLARALMNSAMEFIVVVLYLAAGFAAKRTPRGMTKQGQVDEAGDAKTALHVAKQKASIAGPGLQ